MSPTVIGMYRIAVTEANRFPDLVKAFYEQGPGRTTSRLAEVLEAATERGRNPRPITASGWPTISSA